jgi:riboflavin kinase / FMN adenylyltransferase
MDFLLKVQGVVVRGDGRGRQIGFPTANIDFESNQNIELGVYAATTVVDGITYKSAAHIGPASTFGKKKVTFEVFILDFDKDIYDQNIEVELVKKIRGTVKFNSVQELIIQMNQDVESARNILQVN